MHTLKNKKSSTNNTTCRKLRRPHVSNAKKTLTKKNASTTSQVWATWWGKASPPGVSSSRCICRVCSLQYRSLPRLKKKILECSRLRLRWSLRKSKLSSHRRSRHAPLANVHFKSITMTASSMKVSPPILTTCKVSSPSITCISCLQGKPTKKTSTSITKAKTCGRNREIFVTI